MLTKIATVIINNRKVHDLRGNLDRHELKSNEDIQYELKVVGLLLFLTFNCTSKYYLIAIIYIFKEFCNILLFKRSSCKLCEE